MGHMTEAPSRPYFRSLTRGLKGRCPHCGKAALFYRYLKVEPVCQTCGHDLDRYPADDGPAYFTIRNTPTRLASLAADPWADFRQAAAPIETRKAGKPARKR